MPVVVVCVVLLVVDFIPVATSELLQGVAILLSPLGTRQQVKELAPASVEVMLRCVEAILRFTEEVPLTIVAVASVVRLEAVLKHPAAVYL